MTWRKLGLVYCANSEDGWRQTHAFLPTPLLRDDDTIRVFVAFLDAQKIGRVGYVDIDSQNPLRVLGVSTQPVLDIGRPGAFDDSGVTPMCLVQDSSMLRLYYTGWQSSSTVRYYLMTGLAISDDGGATFRRHSEVPVLDRCDDELIVRTAAHVRHENDTWRMWYIGGSDTICVDGKQVPTYDMRYATSPNGIVWSQPGKVLLRPQGADEYGFGRPFLATTRDGYKMWYSIRSRSRGYHLGCARSEDGLSWQRLQDLTLESGADKGDWDQNMQCFGAVLDTKWGRYLFYNGNDYGRTGFGVAVWRNNGT